jgi:sn-glycerol 3-phosphate transport system ATP-binding protein
MTLGNRIVVMNGGHVEQIGVPSEVYAAPASAFVASFIGSPAMNLWKGRVSEDRRFFDVDGQGPRLPISPEHGATPAPLAARSVVDRLQPGREYTLGIRAEHMMPREGVPSVAVTVETCELLGADNLAHGRFGQQDVVWRLHAAHRPREGERLNVALPPEHLHFFDSTTGLRVP